MPQRLRAFRLRLVALLHPHRQQHDFEDELAFHHAMVRERMEREGATPEESHIAAQRAFGNTGRWRERLAELRQFTRLENIRRDLVFATRLLRKSPGFTITALLTIALGIGANTAVFSLINGLLLRPLPVPDAQQLVVFGSTQDGQTLQEFPAPVFRALERDHPAFANVFAISSAQFQIGSRGGSEEVPGVMVSGQYFDALQTPPLLGRYLTPSDDQPGTNPSGLAAVVGENYWRTALQSDPHVIGRKLFANHVQFTIVGVMPKRFIGTDPTARPRIFLPLSAEPLLDAPSNNVAAGYNIWWLVTMGRKKPGVSLEQAEASLASVTRFVFDDGRAHSAWGGWMSGKHLRITVQPGATGFADLRTLYTDPLKVILILCVGMLSLACLNLASLLVARAATREQELATRLAIGATRGRLIQQLLLESILLSVAGTILGVAAAPFTAHALAGLLLGNNGSYMDTSLDRRLLALCAAAVVLAVIVIGLIPALHATGASLGGRLKTSGPSARTCVHIGTLPRILLSLQIALALVLVIGAGLISVSLVRTYRVGPGFDPHGINFITLRMSKQPLEGERLTQLYHSLNDAIAAQPGVSGVSLLNKIPFTSIGGWVRYSKPGGGETPNIYMNRVAPDYFRTMRIPLLDGRDFRWNDTAAGGKKIILSRAAAAALFPGQSAIGKSVGGNQVIGIVGNTTYNDIRQPAPFEGYFSVTQDDDKKPSYTFVARVDGPSTPFAGAVRAILARQAPDVPAPVFTTMSSTLDQSLSAQRMMALLSVFFAACALLVTAIGLYGTLAYRTARRTSEIGIRIALGAKRLQVVALVLRQNVVATIVGALAGIAVALLAARTLASFLYGTSAHDPLVLLVSLSLLALVAGVASLLPAIRAARINPLTAIRTE